MPDVPEFLMIGVAQADGVAIYASTKLTVAQLRSETEVESDPFVYPSRLKPGRTTFFVTAKMSEFVVAFGPTYADALRHLMETWKPEPAEQPALPGRQALEC